jgi:hypothetical protein
VAGVVRLDDQVEVTPQVDSGRPWQPLSPRPKRIVALAGW